MPLLIRPANYQDAEEILKIYAPFITNTPVSFEEIVPDPDEIIARIENTARELPYLVCVIDNEIAGYAYASNHRTRSAYRWTKELSVYIHPDFKRRKIGKALYYCVIEVLKYQGVCSLLAGITLPNPESIGFHENMGFSKVAELHATGFKLGKWYDVGWWELSLNPGKADPRENLIPFPEIPGTVIQRIAQKGTAFIIP
jgi:L-amino acid N-acyltransferase YncA